MRTHTLLFALAVALLFVSCKDNKQEANEIIIADQPTVEPQKGPTTMSGREQHAEILWLNSDYTVHVQRRSNSDLPVVTDENGRKYYDNEVVVEVLRADGTMAISHTFTKNAFAQYLGRSAVAQKGALLGVVYDKTDGDNLVFAASVGSPDELSDEYVPMIVKINRVGAVSITTDTKLDSYTSQYDEDGV